MSDEHQGRTFSVIHTCCWLVRFHTKTLLFQPMAARVPSGESPTL